VSTRPLRKLRLTTTLMQGGSIDFNRLLYFLLVSPCGLLDLLQILGHFIHGLWFEELGVCDRREFLAQLEILRITVRVCFKPRVGLQLRVDLLAAFLKWSVLLLEDCCVS